MKKDSQKSKLRFWLGTVGVALVLLVICPPRAEAQTNTFPDNGNVGIGTTAPISKLQVVGDLAMEANAGGTSGIGLVGLDTSNAYLQLYDSTRTLKVYLPSKANLNGYFNNGGNFGIGTSSPAALFNVVKNQATGTEIRINNSDAAGFAGMYLNGGFAQAIGGFVQYNNTSGAKNLFVATGGADPLYLGTNNSIRMTVLPTSGNVGIGTTTPVNPLHVNSGTTPANTQIRVTANGLGSLSLLNYAADNIQIGFDQDWSGSTMTARNTSVARIVKSAGKLTFGGNTGQTVGSGINSQPERLTIDLATGNVGIGTTSPTKKLDVLGDITASGAITGGTINAKYQDVAEWVQSSQILSAGTVVVLDHTRSNQVIASSQAYDTRVAGVISLQPGIALGESGAGKVLVATTGRVKIKVDATAESIRIGDLLVTSDKEGVAKKSEPLSLGGVAIHRPGTLIGKALEPLAKGQGEILVLLSLQ